jgi:hypothetical protein
MRPGASNVVLLGSSNCLLASGFVPSLLQGFEMHGIAIDEFRNLAIGATPCTLGLEQLAALPAGNAPDILVIEYAITDVHLARPERLELWKASFEGIIRHALDRNPSCRIFPVIFGQRSFEKTEIWAPYLPLMFDLERHYECVHIIDIDGFMKRRFSGVHFKNLYADEHHYSPGAAHGVGLHIAGVIANRLRRPPMALKPDKLYNNCFDRVVVLDLSEVCPAQRVFENSVFCLKTGVIRQGESVEVHFPGRLISATFVASQDSGSMQMSTNTDSFFAHTNNLHVENGKFSFLLCGLFCHWVDFSIPAKPCFMEIKATAEKDAQAVWRPFLNMRPTTVPRPSVYLRTALIELPL